MEAPRVRLMVAMVHENHRMSLRAVNRGRSGEQFDLRRLKKLVGL